MPCLVSFTILNFLVRVLEWLSLSGPTAWAFHPLLHLRTEVLHCPRNLLFFGFILNNRQCIRLQIAWFQNTSHICNKVSTRICVLLLICNFHMSVLFQPNCHYYYCYYFYYYYYMGISQAMPGATKHSEYCHLTE